MHTLFVIIAGLGLLGTMLLGVYVVSDNSSTSLVTASLCFIPLWFVICVFNLWMGISKAGYSLADELPFLLINFTVPTFVALYVGWKLN